MKKWLIGALLFCFAVTILSAKGTVVINQVDGDNVQEFQMRFAQKKVQPNSADLRHYKLVIGFRNYNDTGRQTAYLALAVTSTKGFMKWKKDGMTLTGSDGKTFHIKTSEEPTTNNVAAFFTSKEENYLLDIQEFRTPADLVNFYKEIAIAKINGGDGFYTLTLKGEATFYLRVAQADFEEFFATLKDPKKMITKGSPSVKAYDLLAASPARAK